MSDVDVAVVIPLEDPRGDVAEHLRTWTQAQTLSRERFQVVLCADGRHPDFERQVAAELAAQDEVVSVPGGSLMDLYDAGARAGRGTVLILTEAHVRADPRCLAAVAEAFAADPELDAATLTHVQVTSSGISRLSARWLERCFEAWRRAGWVRLNTTAVAIRGETYVRIGGIDTRLGLYAPSLMSARLDEQGPRIKHLDEAVVNHQVEEGMRHSVKLGGDFSRGEVVVRRELDPEFCERYFGPAGIWERRGAYRGENARSMVSALGAAIRRSPRDAGWLSRELLARLPARIAGPHPRRAWERAATRINVAVAATPALPDGARWRSYQAAHARNIRAIQLEEMADENGAPPPAAAGGPIGAERLDGVLIGAHGVEAHHDRRFRWTEPVALLRLAPSPNGSVLRLETGGLRGDPLGYLQGVYAGSLPLPSDLMTGHGDALEISLPTRLARAAADSGLVLVCRPLKPPDGARRLGIPVSELELKPA